MTLTLSIIQKSYDLTVEVNGVTLTTTLVASSHTHMADEISDASALGRNIMRAADAATVRTLIGAGTGGGAGLSDGDHGGVIVSGGGTVLELDYAEINATVQPAWSRITGLPNTMADYGIGDGLTTTAAALAYQPLSAVLTATTASYTTAEKSKLAAIAAGATANATDAQLRDRSTHTGTQPASSISGLAAVATTGAFADLTEKPMTIAGYGITDIPKPLPIITPPSGTWVHLFDGRGALGLRAETANLFRMAPCIFTYPVSLTTFGLNVTTGVAGSLAKIAIYAADASGLPTTLLGETGGMDCASTGIKTASLGSAIMIPANTVFWTGVRVSSNQALTTSTGGIRIQGAGSMTTLVGIPTCVSRFVTYASAAPLNWGWNITEMTTNRDPWWVGGLLN